jgi:hypothetical protein
MVGLMKMCLNNTYSRVWVGKHLSDTFPIRNDLKKGDVLSPLLLKFALEYASGRVQVRHDSLKLSFWLTLMMLIFWADVYEL